jgi:hypothetical protein
MVAKSTNNNSGDQLTQEAKVRKNAVPIGFEVKLSHRIKAASPLTLISSITLFCIGVCVVTLSIAGHINPLWLASLMSIFGSVSTMIGLYQIYELLSERSELDNLYKEAIKRVINSQN